MQSRIVWASKICCKLYIFISDAVGFSNKADYFGYENMCPKQGKGIMLEIFERKIQCCQKRHFIFLL